MGKRKKFPRMNRKELPPRSPSFDNEGGKNIPFLYFVINKKPRRSLPNLHFKGLTTMWRMGAKD